VHPQHTKRAQELLPLGRGVQCRHGLSPGGASAGTCICASPGTSTGAVAGAGTGVSTGTGTGGTGSIYNTAVHMVRVAVAVGVRVGVRRLWPRPRPRPRPLTVHEETVQPIYDAQHSQVLDLAVPFVRFQYPSFS
jgi:hypothetical protein